MRIGTRGAFPPNFVESAATGLFLIPDSALAKARGGRHLLAVRVYNDYAYGGLMRPVKVGPYEVLAETRSPRDMVIGTMVAQNPNEPALAAARGVVWHGLAAEALAQRRGQVAVRTTQILDELGTVLRER